jgi:hypothetical protein
VGAWGDGHFENDDALDWLWTLEGDSDGHALRDALFPVATGQSTAEDPEVEASIAVAAAAVVAKSRGLSDEMLPEGAEDWVRNHGTLVDDPLVEAARLSVARVTYALSEEAGVEGWLAAVRLLGTDLNRR